MTIGVVGGGIIGLAVAHRITETRPGERVVVLEKESRIGAHQTSHNSGVVHAGIFYAPGSLKARLCRRGAEMLGEFCAQYRIANPKVGKLVVASVPEEVDGLDEIERRARLNGVSGIRRLSAGELREIEPSVVGVAALHSPNTSIVDFAAVAQRLANLVTERGGDIRTDSQVMRIRESASVVDVDTPSETYQFRRLFICGGLHNGELSDMARIPSDTRIVPFRGEFYRLLSPVNDLVRGLVYPVPDPRYPFLGVHFTRQVTGEVLIGPNAVLAASLEGYSWREIELRSILDIVRWSGTRKLVRHHWRTGASELLGSLSRHAFVNRARGYVPELRDADVERAPSGVRAQAVDRHGSLVDDFLIDTTDRINLIRNAPSPAATSSLAIAEYVINHTLF